MSVSVPVLLVVAHVTANVVWIGAILAVALLVGRARFMADVAEVGALARRVYSRLATPAFLVSFVAGVARIALAPAVYAHLPWMHVKLTFALVVIALHHVIGARARRVANGDARAGSGVGVLATIALVGAAGAVFLGVAKSLP
ncbi:MAG: CopD family protein [Myxococcota bacterium]|nr:CopD family protein [Myxococcota bacterium]